MGAHLAFNSERVYKSLKVISVLNKKVIADVLPYLLSEVEKIEKISITECAKEVVKPIADSDLPAKTPFLSR